MKLNHIRSTVAFKGMMYIALWIFHIHKHVCVAVSARAKGQQRSSSVGRRGNYEAWREGMIDELIREAEIRDKRAWAEETFPGISLGHRRTKSTSAVFELKRLKNAVPLKVIRQLVKDAELRDYRVKAKGLTPKGDYYGMKNFLRALSDSSYFSKRLFNHLNNFPRKSQPLSLHELVTALDDGAFDDVFLEHGLDSVPSSSHSDSEVSWRDSKL